jgi:hypothetical protein
MTTSSSHPDKSEKIYLHVQNFEDHAVDGNRGAEEMTPLCRRSVPDRAVLDTASVPKKHAGRFSQGGVATWE